MATFARTRGSIRKKPQEFGRRNPGEYRERSNDRNETHERPERGERPGRSFGGPKRSFGGRPAGAPGRLHDAVCSTCGRECQVPFRPSGTHPVFCSNCFVKEGKSAPSKFGRDNFREKSFDRRAPSFERNAGPDNKSVEQLKQQFESLNHKLDKIIKLLSPATPFVPMDIVDSTEEETMPVVAKKVRAKKRKE